MPTINGKIITNITRYIFTPWSVMIEREAICDKLMAERGDADFKTFMTALDEATEGMPVYCDVEDTRKVLGTHRRNTIRDSYNMHPVIREPITDEQWDMMENDTAPGFDSEPLGDEWLD